MRQVALEYAGRPRWVRVWVKMASEPTTDRISLKTRGYEAAKQALEYQPRCAGVPCWDLEALVLRIKDAEKVVEVSGFGCAKGGRSLA